jgi:hemerythrin-like domain-containing protein
MNVVGLLPHERRMIETSLDVLEALVRRLNAGEVFPNSLLVDAVEFLREFTNDGQVGCAHIAPRDEAQTHLREMLWTLELLERGETGAAGAFVTSAREYIQLLRAQLRQSQPGM